MVVKEQLEPELEKQFHPDSYGYRPNKSALEAVGQARKRCWKSDWVLDLDIKGFFDNIDHELMMKAVRKHTDENGTTLHRAVAESPVKVTDGTQKHPEKGCDKGVISPLLANFFLNNAFDQ